MATQVEDNCTRTHCGIMNVSERNDSHAIFDEKEMPLEDILKLTFEVLIALFGVLDNGLVIIVVGRLGKKKQPTDLYVQNLAIADLGLLLLAFPLVLIKRKTPWNWPLGEFTCRYLYPVPDIFHGASVCFIAVIAIERYRKVVTVKTPVKNKCKTLLRRAKTVSAGVWLISFLIFCVPLYFVVEYREPPNGGKWCGPVWPAWDRRFMIAKVYMGSLTLFSYILPLIVISLTYLAISRTIKRSNKFIKAMNWEQNDDNEWQVKSIRLNHNNRARKILTPIVLVFAFTMAPLHILRIALVFWPTMTVKQYYKVLLFVISILVTINSSANPVIYSVFSRDFRKRTINLCFRR